MCEIILIYCVVCASVTKHEAKVNNSVVVIKSNKIKERCIFPFVFIMGANSFGTELLLLESCYFFFCTLP